MNKRPFKLGAVVFALVALLAIAMMVHSSSGGSFRQIQAITMCQSALKKASGAPEKADIPSVKNARLEPEYRFVWDATTQMTRVPNGRGEMEAMSAMCEVDGPTMRVVGLVLGRRSII